jgi:cobalt-zinc-cadmium efflux system membrane fusion protein
MQLGENKMLLEKHHRWFAIAALVIVAAASGFGIARLTGQSAPAPAVAPAPAGPATLKIDPKEIAAAGIVVEPAVDGNLSAEILAPAMTAAQPSGVATLTAHAEGMISRLNKRLGDPVRAGEVLAVVDSKDAAQIASDRASAQARAVLARRVAEQEESLFQQGATSKRSLQTAQASLAAAEADARRARDAATTVNLASDGHSVEVISPLSGRITAQTTALGAYVRTETELFRISDPRLVQVEAQLAAIDAAGVRPGDSAVLMLPNGKTAEAVVRSVTPALDPQTRTQTAVLSVPEGLPLAPGETLQVRIRLKGTASTGIVLPEEAVQTIDGRDAVFARTDNGFVVRHVAVGSRGAGRASIISGLKSGEQIATRNAFLLKAELGKGAEDEE